MRYGALSLMFLLTACAVAVAPFVIEDKLTRLFFGLPASHFFEVHGSAAEEFQAPGGGRVEYRWASGNPNGSYCELRITASPERIIRRIYVTVDTPGWRTASRCSEIFWDQ